MVKRKVKTSEAEEEKKIPWEWLTEDHLKEYGYSGTLIRALRIKHNMSREVLANHLRRRISYIKKLESKNKIGIKDAKALAYIFKEYIEDWRTLREDPLLKEKRGHSPAINQPI